MVGQISTAISVCLASRGAIRGVERDPNCLPSSLRESPSSVCVECWRAASERSSATDASATAPRNHSTKHQDDLLSTGLAPVRQRPCWAHQKRTATRVSSAGRSSFSHSQRRNVGSEPCHHSSPTATNSAGVTRPLAPPLYVGRGDNCRAQGEDHRVLCGRVLVTCEYCGPSNTSQVLVPAISISMCISRAARARAGLHVSAGAYTDFDGKFI